MKEICNTNLTTQETNIEVIKKNIYEIRGQRVMIDRDLAELYEVETRRLNEAVKRNVERFPEDFMFQLNRKEFIFITLRYTTKIEENPNLISQLRHQVGMEPERCPMLSPNSASQY